MRHGCGSVNAPVSREEREPRTLRGPTYGVVKPATAQPIWHLHTPSMQEADVAVPTSHRWVAIFARLRPGLFFAKCVLGSRAALIGQLGGGFSNSSSAAPRAKTVMFPDDSEMTSDSASVCAVIAAAAT